MFPEYEYREQPIYAKIHGKQGNYPPRFHKHVEILAVINQALRLTVRGVTYTLKPGDLYIIFPNVLHTIEARNTKAMVLLVDYEKCQVFQEQLLHSIPETPVLRKGMYPESVQSTMMRMIDLAAAHTPYQQETLAGYANGILGELLGCLTLIPRNMDGPLVQQLQFYMMDNYTRDLTLDSVAQALGYSKFYISRTLKELFGCNFRSLINSYRIALAQNLLISDDSSIARIAGQCGFQSQSAFTRTFLAHTGMTPSQYRRQISQPPKKPELCKK